MLSKSDPVMRAQLSLLLCLSLVFNAVVAPWAMAHAAPQGDTGSASHHTAHGDVDQPMGTKAGSHADHRHHGASHSDADGEQASDSVVSANQHQGQHGGQHDCETDAGCCGSASCQCGCTPPPVVLAVVFPGLGRSVPADITDATTPLALVASSHPPFRPPAD